MPIATIRDWIESYACGEISLGDVLTQLRQSLGPDPAWTHLATAAVLQAQFDALTSRLADFDGDIRRLPLSGVPFAVKDNIDVAGLPTSAGCPEFSYTPETSAEAVSRLQRAGAVLMGKTNLDQFATGLVGTR